MASTPTSARRCRSPPCRKAGNAPAATPPAPAAQARSSSTATGRWSKPLAAHHPCQPRADDGFGVGDDAADQFGAGGDVVDQALDLAGGPHADIDVALLVDQPPS